MHYKSQHSYTVAFEAHLNAGHVIRCVVSAALHAIDIIIRCRPFIMPQSNYAEWPIEALELTLDGHCATDLTL